MLKNKQSDLIACVKTPNIQYALSTNTGWAKSRLTTITIFPATSISLLFAQPVYYKLRDKGGGRYSVLGNYQSLVSKIFP